MAMNFGLLSTIDEPLLPYMISSALSNGVNNIIVICDKKVASDKDRKIWLERTGGSLERDNDGHVTIYNIADGLVPFYFVESHNNEQTLNIINHYDIKCLLNAGTPRRLSAKIIGSVPNGIVNIHPGLLPNYRGCSCVEWAIYNNDSIWNTAQFMDMDYDTGPIITTQRCEFPIEASYQDIRVRVYRNACILAGHVLALIQNTNMKPADGLPQKEGTYYDPIPDDKFNSVLQKIKSGRYAPIVSK
jgi:methionyl-tRNA formyltransferase